MFGLSFSAQRESVVDFTQPYIQEGTALVSRARRERDRSMAVFTPFSLPVSLLSYHVIVDFGVTDQMEYLRCSLLLRSVANLVVNKAVVGFLCHKPLGRRWYSGLALGYASLGSRVQISVIR